MDDTSTMIERMLAALADGPLSEADLASAVGLDPDDDGTWELVNEALDTGQMAEVYSPDGVPQVVGVAGLITDFTVSHRVTSGEAEAHRIEIGLDLAPLFHLHSDPDPVMAGDQEAVVSVGPVARGEADITIELPDGWEPDLAEGDLLRLTVDGESLRLSRAQAGGAVPDGIAADSAGLVGAFEALLEGSTATLSVLADPERDPAKQWVFDIASVAVPLLVHHRDELGVLADRPLSEVLDEHGWPHLGALVGGPSVVPEQLASFSRGLEVASAEYPLTAEHAAVVLDSLLTPAPGSVPAEALARMIVEAKLSEDLVDWFRAGTAETRAAAEPRIAELRAALPTGRADEATTTMAALHAAVLLGLGRADEAKTAIDVVAASSQVSEETRDALDQAARFRAVSGDLAGAISIYQRMGDVELADQMRRYLPVLPDVGRNEPCPCGSGRKAKQCCLRNPKPRPLDERVGLVWSALAAWVMGEQTSAVAALARDSHEIVSGAGMAEVVGTALVLHAFDGGGLARALSEIGDVMPADEAELARSWPERRHRLWLVEVDDDARVWWSDEATGEKMEVVGAVGGIDDETAEAGHVLGVTVPTPLGHLSVGDLIRVEADDLAQVRFVLEAGPSPLDLAVTALMLLSPAPSSDQ